MRLKSKHPLALRWFHWVNFPLLLVMVWSGLLIYWADSSYQVLGWRLFPTWFYKAFGLQYGLARGMAWHFSFAWFFALNGVLYVLYTLWSGEWRHLLPGRSSPREAWQEVLHELRLRPEAPACSGKYKAAQRLAYTGVVLMGFGSLVTGLAIYKPVQLSWLTTLMGGYPLARWFHFWLTMGVCAFFLVHVVQVARAGWNNFRAMVTGYELVSERKEGLP